MKKLLLKIILGLCVAAVVTFAVLIVRELYIDLQSRSFYDDMAAVFEMSPGGQGSGDADNSGQNNNNPETGAEDNGDDDVFFIDFDALKELLPKAVGWIRLGGTVIDYPIMQYTDNDYFMTRLPDGTKHRNGSIFLDYRNKPDFSDKSILIYGHHTRAGDMFGTLSHYRNQDFYDANPIIDIYTPDGNYELIIFAGHLAHSFNDHPPLDFATDDEFFRYIQQIKNKSVFSSDFEVTASDQIISLVTCAYDFNNARLIIVGVIKET